MKANDAGNISLVYGLLGAVFGILSLGGLLIGTNMLSTFPREPQVEKMKLYFTALQSVLFIYMPVMIIIGLLYILSGFLIKKGKKEGISFGVVSAILNIIWFVGYAISVYTVVLPAFPHKFHPSLFLGAMIITGIIICLYPTYYLISFKKIDINLRKPN